jgi:hypothetical protein
LYHSRGEATMALLIGMLSRDACDALARFSTRQRATIVARTVARMHRAYDAQKRRRGLPVACPFTCCHWEASRVRLSSRVKLELRDHVIAAHATALLLEE